MSALATKKKHEEIPSTLEVAPIGGLTTTIYRYPTYYKIDYTETGVPEVRGTLLLSNGEIESAPSKFRYISEETASRFPRVRLEPGDIVMSVRGTMGKIGIVREYLKGAVITANLIRLAPSRERINPEFFRWALLSPQFVINLSAASPQTTMTIPNLSRSRLSKLPIALPSIQEQNSIASILDACEAKISNATHKVEVLQNLFRLLLHGLMTANIRVSNTNCGL